MKKDFKIFLLLFLAIGVFTVGLSAQTGGSSHEMTFVNGNVLKVGEIFKSQDGKNYIKLSQTGNFEVWCDGNRVFESKISGADEFRLDGEVAKLKKGSQTLWEENVGSCLKVSNGNIKSFSKCSQDSVIANQDSAYQVYPGADKPQIGKTAVPVLPTGEEVFP